MTRASKRETRTETDKDKDTDKQCKRQKERERECKIPLYNLDSQSYQDMRSILNPLNSHSSLPLCDQAVVQSGLSQSSVLSQCHTASLHPLMHLAHSCAQWDSDI